MTPLERELTLALLRAVTELEYAQERMGQDRAFTRGETIRNAKAALRKVPQEQE